MRFLLYKLGIYMAAMLATYGLAVLGSTGAVVSSLAAMGIDVPTSTAFGMYGRDLVGMAGMFLPMVAFALLIAFMVTALIRRYFKPWPFFLYALAGATAVLCIHLGLEAAFAISPIAVARSLPGMLTQALAGAAGGALYFYLTSKIPRST